MARLQSGLGVNRGLVGYWPLGNKGTVKGNVALDLVGNRNPGTLVGSPTLVKGLGGAALSFNGSGQYVQVASFPYSDAVTFSGWVQRQGGIGSVYQSVAMHHTTDGTASDWYLYFHSDNKLHIDIPWVAADVVVGSATVSDLNWHHLAFTRRGSSGSWTYQLFIDGKLDNAASTASNPVNSAWALSFSKAVSPNAYAIDNATEFRVHSRVLSPSEIWHTYSDRTGRLGLSVPIRRRLAAPSGSSPTTLAPSLAALLLTGGTPLISGGTLLSPAATSLLLSGATPTFTAGSLLAPSASSVLLTGSAPSVSVLAVLTPSAAALLMSGTTPAIVTNAVSSPTAAALLLAGATPVLVGLGTVSPTASSLRLTGATPLIGAGSLLVPSASGLILTGATPGVIAGGVSALTLTPSAGHFILTGLTPPVFALAPKPGRTSSPTAYTPGDSPNLPGGDQRYLQTELGKISASLATVIRLLPQPATVAPKGPLDGMQRLARAPWRPVAGVTTDAWVFYDAPSSTWLLLHAN